MADRFAEHTVVRLREVPYVTYLNVQLDPAGPAAGPVAEVLGTPVPTTPNTVATAAGIRVLWLAPQEWLVAAADGAGAELAARLREALTGDDAGSVVDVSANRTTLELSGASARDVLEKGCSLDLHPRVFGPGQCAQTMVSKVNVVLDQLDEEPTYRLLVRGSFAQYLADWLLDAL
jgi:sarcosine oxidase subunit gamma